MKLKFLVHIRSIIVKITAKLNFIIVRNSESFKNQPSIDELQFLQASYHSKNDGEKSTPKLTNVVIDEGNPNHKKKNFDVLIDVFNCTSFNDIHDKIEIVYS